VVNPFVANELRSVSLLQYGEESLAKKLFGWGIEKVMKHKGGKGSTCPQGQQDQL